MRDRLYADRSMSLKDMRQRTRCGPLSVAANNKGTTDGRPMLNDQAMTRDSLYGTAAESTYAGITSFMRRRYSRDLRGVDVAVSGVPFDTATSNRPARASGHGDPRRVHRHRLGTPLAVGVRPVRSSGGDRLWRLRLRLRLAAVDAGMHRSPCRTHPQCRHAMLTFGGDHFITYPLLKAHARKHGALSLIHFDAHSDTWPDEEGKRIDHGTMFWHAAKEGLVDPARSVQIGLRTTNDDHQGFAVLDARQVHRRGWRRLSRRSARGSATTRCT
jgi:agmatinase